MFSIFYKYAFGQPNFHHTVMHHFLPSKEYSYYFQVFDGLMETYENSKDYNPTEWEQYSVFYTTYFTYNWGIHACNTFDKT